MPKYPFKCRVAFGYFTFGPGGPASPLGPKSPGSPRDPCRIVLGRVEEAGKDVPRGSLATQVTMLEKPALETMLRDHLPSR